MVICFLIMCLVLVITCEGGLADGWEGCLVLVIWRCGTDGGFHFSGPLWYGEVVEGVNEFTRIPSLHSLQTYLLWDTANLPPLRRWVNVTQIDFAWANVTQINFSCSVLRRKINFNYFVLEQNRFSLIL